jgi:hypothetical protein
MASMATDVPLLMTAVAAVLKENVMGSRLLLPLPPPLPSIALLPTLKAMTVALPKDAKNNKAFS